MKITITRYLLALLVFTMFTQASFAQTSVASGVTNAGYSLNTSAQTVDPGLAITSSSSITGFKVTISSGLKSSDVLSYTGTLPSGITVTAYNSSTGVITFNGSATASNWQTFLRTVTYSNSNTAQYGDRIITFSAGNLSGNSNGHFYELVSTSGSWTTSKASAAARTYLGLTGYLATITSASENAFIRQVLNADAWIGCSDEVTQINTATGVTTYGNQTAAEGKWYWVTGPEKGTMFSVGNGSPVTQSGQYANWNSGEPNNSGSEHYGEIYSSGSTPGAWNDLPNVSLPYVVEYGGLATDPIQTISTSTTIYTRISSNTTSSGQIICGSTSPSTITGATPYGGYGTYTYNWISSTTSSTAGFGNASGTINNSSYSPGTLATTTWFRRVVSSGSLSDTTSAIAITVNPAVTSSASTTNVSCNGSANGSASILASGGTPSFAYAWSPSGGTGATATNLSNGSYTCVVTDAAGCTSSQVYTITQPTALTTASTSQTNIACNGNSTGTASVTASGGTSSYSYSWSPSGGTAASASSLSAGSYSCLITDANGCTAQRNFTITQPAVLSVSSSITNVACNGDATGAATMTPAGGTSAYTYVWSNGGTTSSKSLLVAGTYTCTVTDANSCTSVQLITISQPAALAATTSDTDVDCFGNTNGAASVTVSGGTTGYTYSWSPSGGTSTTASNLSAGSYTCVITDANACTLSKNFTISQPSVLAANTSVTNVACNNGTNGTAVLTPSGGTGTLTYSWTPSVSSTSSASGLGAGSYSCVITDANGCTVTKNMTVTQPAAFNVNATSTNNLCNGQSMGSTSVSVSGSTSPYTYSWSNGGSTNSTSGLTAGTYTCTITDANSCVATEVITITQPTVLSATTTSSNVSCNSGSNAAATVNVSGGTAGYTYSWAPSGGTGATASGLVAGSYTCNVTDANGCTTSQNFTLTEPAVLAATSASNDVNCNSAATGSASVSPSGGTASYTYAWAPSGGTAATATGLTAGNYSCMITDANSCVVTELVTISEPTAMAVTQSSTNVACNTGTNGSASVTVSGGNGPYTFLWSNGGTTDAENNLVAGNYICTITDANGCDVQSLFIITAPNTIASTVSITNPICFGGEGSATVNSTGGTGTLSYSWSTGGNGPVETNLYAGTYSVITTDGNGCTSQELVVITAPAQIQNSISYTMPMCNGGTGDVTVTPSGGTGAFTYSWTNGNTTATQTGLVAGGYDVVVTDANGCTKFTTVTMTQPAAITLSTTMQDPLCNGGVGTATVVANGGTAGYTYSWITGGTTDTEGNLVAGTYQVVVTDQNGCTSTTNAVVVEPTVISTSSTTTNELTGNDGTIDLTVTGGTPGYTFAWNNGAATEDLSGLAAGDYTVLVTDANGCTFSITITVSSSVGLFDPIAGGQIISVYPNPSNGSITLKGVKAGQYRVVDAVGRMMTSFTVQQQDLVNLDLSNVSNGLYFIQSMNQSISLAKFNIIK